MIEIRTHKLRSDCMGIRSTAALREVASNLRNPKEKADGEVSERQARSVCGVLPASATTTETCLCLPGNIDRHH